MVHRIVLVRHGATEWSETGQHTGRTDLPLTAKGERQAESLRARLAPFWFARVLVSPLRRATRTVELAGFGDRAERSDLLLEMNYGDDEGRTRDAIRQERPGWDIFVDGPKNGETVMQVADRAGRVLADVANTVGDVLIVSHGHFLRIMAITHLGFDPHLGQRFDLGPASISVLGHLHEVPALIHWNIQGD